MLRVNLQEVRQTVKTVFAFVFKLCVSGLPMCRIVGCGGANNVITWVNVIIIKILNERKGETIIN